MIAVPYHLGRRDLEVGRGPTKILEALNVSCEVLEYTGSAEAELEAVAAINLQLARAVAAHQGAPLVLAGSCNCCLGILAGLAREDLGVIWFDAHGDFNTPETSMSGKLDGMALAIATGGCHEELRRRIGLERPVPGENVLVVAARDFDPGEVERLARSAVRVIGLPTLPDALDSLKRRVASVYLHLDIDVLDRRLSPGVNCTAPGGITPGQLYAAIRLIHSRIPIAAAALANFNPERDQQNRTLEITLRLAGILGEVALS